VLDPHPAIDDNNRDRVRTARDGVRAGEVDRIVVPKEVQRLIFVDLRRLLTNGGSEVIEPDLVRLGEGDLVKRLRPVDGIEDHPCEIAVGRRGGKVRLFSFLYSASRRLTQISKRRATPPR
jgi:hypothetical protein